MDKNKDLYRNNLSSFILIITLLFLSYTIIYIFSNEQIKGNVLDERKEKLISVVDILYSLADDYEKQYRSNMNLKLTVLQEEFINIVQKLRYDNNEYFFIIDGKGNIVIDPLHPELSWWNMLYEVDLNGNFIFKDLVNNAIRDDEAFVKTIWKSKYNAQIFEEQFIYGRYYWPWDWIICSTTYSDDLSKTAGEKLLPLSITMGISFLVIAIILLFLLRIIKIPLHFRDST